MRGGIAPMVFAAQTLASLGVELAGDLVVATNTDEEFSGVLEAIAGLRREWSRREEFEHPFLSRPALLPTMARSGEWPVTYPGVV